MTVAFIRLPWRVSCKNGGQNRLSGKRYGGRHQGRIDQKADIPSDIARNLGTENGKIIGIFVNDTIANSHNKDSIEMSEEVFHYMYQLKLFNYKTSINILRWSANLIKLLI